jgi:DNA polymerase I
VEEPFRPWLLSDMRMEMDGVHWQELKGELEGRRMLKHLAVCDGREAFEDLRRALRDQHREIIAYGSFARQYLMLSGKTLFKGMTFADLHRVQLDIETTTLTPDQQGAQVLMIALSDTRGYEALLDGDEKQILEQLIERIQALDPMSLRGTTCSGSMCRIWRRVRRRWACRCDWGATGRSYAWGRRASASSARTAAPSHPLLFTDATSSTPT